MVYDANGTITFIPNQQNHLSIPTYVAFTETSRQQSHADLQRTICNLDGLLRHRTYDAANQTYVAVDDTALPTAQVFLKDEMNIHDPLKLAGMFFRNLKSTAEGFIGQEVNEAFVSVGQAYTNYDKSMVEQALVLGGFDQVHVIRNGILAGLAYDLDEVHDSNDYSTSMVVYEIGSASTEAAVVEIEDGIFETLSIVQDDSINEGVLNRELVDHAKKMHPELEELDDSLIDVEMEVVRKILSFNDTAQFTMEIPHTKQCLKGTVTQEDLHRILAPYIPRMVSQMESTIRNANLTTHDISDMIIIGGTANILALQTELVHHLPSTITVRNSISPESVVARGFAKVLNRDQDPIVGNYDTSIQSLGVRTAGGIATPIIPRISIIPSKKSRVFTTVNDNQKRAVIEMYEGDRGTIGNNTVLARVEVEDIPPGKRGIPRIEVAMELSDFATGQYRMTVTLHGRGGEQSVVGNLPLRSYDEMKAILDDFDDNFDKDLMIKAKMEAQLATGEIPTFDTDIVEVGHIWWTETDD
ncbi:hypothetical protein OPT61_g51 [Boeremia exigua]|uniref:Uncharacterized protein n=1 Tax=Boeremia exigua TaxID=749465 RepID=A0ACC2IVG5_9PLEO|nr:hypothetical protein OPT61_g51 [Boeremia exigua]